MFDTIEIVHFHLKQEKTATYWLKVSAKSGLRIGEYHDFS